MHCSEWHLRCMKQAQNWSVSTRLLAATLTIKMCRIATYLCSLQELWLPESSAGDQCTPTPQRGLPARGGFGAAPHLRLTGAGLFPCPARPALLGYRMPPTALPRMPVQRCISIALLIIADQAELTIYRAGCPG